MHKIAYSTYPLTDVNVPSIVIKLAGALNTSMNIANVHTYIYNPFLVHGEPQLDRFRKYGMLRAEGENRILPS